MKKIIVFSIMALVLSPLNPIFHIAKASIAPAPVNENEVAIDPIIEEAQSESFVIPCSGPAVSGDSVISLILPCPSVAPGPNHDFADAEAVVEGIIPEPAPVPCSWPSFNNPSVPSVVLPCPVAPGPMHDLVNAEAIDEIIPEPAPAPAPQPCPSPILINPHILQHLVTPCFIGPNHEAADVEAVDEEIIPTPAPAPIPCPIITPSADTTQVLSADTAVIPCSEPVHDPAIDEEENVEDPTPPAPPAGGGGGGGISIFQTNVLGTTPPTPPTTPDQQVLGEQVFSDGTSTQQVLGEQKFASVLGEKVTSPSFPKTGSAPVTTNSTIWQLSLAFLLSAVLIVSLNQKKAIRSSK